jgi:hypothetical protein
VRRIANFTALALVLLVVFLVRAISLNYNSPFNDEAVYAVVGKMGLYYGDWESMNPFSWVGGLPFLYPAISAISYNLGGIILMRLVSELFFIASLFFFWKIAFLLLSLKGKRLNVFSLLSVIALGFSPTGYYVSGLATYDMPSFFFFVLGIYFLVLASKRVRRQGNHYFLSSLFFILAFYFKYTIGLFLPFLIIFSYLFLKSKNQGQFWLIYFLIPILTGVLGLLLMGFEELKVFYQGQVGGIEKDSPVEILRVFSKETGYTLVLFGLGSVGFFVKKKFKEWLAIALVPGLILLVHLVSLRVPTLDKHVLFASGAFSLIGGLGIGFIYDLVGKSREIKQDFRAIVVALLVIYCVLSMSKYQEYHRRWKNASEPLDQLENLANEGDIILTNFGAPVQLTLFNKIYPTSVFTSDWIYYEGFTGVEAAKNGVGDGYFRIIALDRGENWASEESQKLYEAIISNMDEVYSVVWEDKDYAIYLREY